MSQPGSRYAMWVIEQLEDMLSFSMELENDNSLNKIDYVNSMKYKYNIWYLSSQYVYYGLFPF